MEVTEKQFLTEEEIKTLREIQNETQAVVIELGEIEMVKLQLETRTKTAREFLTQVENKEKSFSQSIFEKYGKSNINPETGEVIKLA
jgi:hypothetical protein